MRDKQFNPYFFDQNEVRYFMEVTDRSLFEAFSADERTLPLLKLRVASESRFDESLQPIHQLASGEESLSFDSIAVAKNSLLRAFQIRYAIKVGCEKVDGHDQVVAKIQLNLDDKLRKSVMYMSEINQWVSIVEGGSTVTLPSA